MERRVFEEYSVTLDGSGGYQVHHVIPLELGGSNSIKKSLAGVPPDLVSERPNSQTKRLARTQAL